jgi:mannan endo-1,4-beta-mannosidase
MQHAEECDAAAFVRVCGTRFTLRGRPWAIAGANCHYAQSWASDGGACAATVDALLHAAASRMHGLGLGLNTLRVWAFNDGDAGGGAWHPLQTGPGVFSEAGLRGLDFVVARAAAHGLRLILSLLNYWPDYGGMDQYLRWCCPAPPPCADDDDVEQRRALFYSDAACRAAFLAAAAALTGRVNTLTGVRYRDDPAILAWELCNEVRAGRGALPLAV